jgi:flagellar hook-basal body complex protein FliE
MKDKRKVFKKNIYSREDSSSSDEDNKSDSDSNRVLFMDTKNKKNDEEGEVDFEAELINALTELKKERKKNIYLKTQLEEGKRKEEAI